ncbi:MAG: hypothetical protein U1U88_002298 [Lawsonella clevelandensis]
MLLFPHFRLAYNTCYRSIQATPVDATASADLTTTGTYRAGITGPDALRAMRSAYRDMMCLVAAADVAHTVDSAERQAPRRDTSERLTELAEAALTAALAVAVATV